MKISYKLLQEYIDCPLTPDALTDALTMAGLEVGSVERLGPNLSQCIVGQILEINQHPNADRLTVCRVDVGKEETLSIVCGAKNMKVGDKVPVALIGCRLPGDLVIKKSKLRGVPSEGMMCSERELALSEESAGLMILPEDAPLGTEIGDYLGLDDVVLEVELTPNRGDCLSMQGIVREIAALTGQKPKKREIVFSENEININDLISVKTVDSDLCPRYAARAISDVNIGPSPAWLVQRLKAMSVRPINNVVDVTNFVLMECGQPLHAFDYDLIGGKGIIVRRAGDNEKIVTLDGVERSLSGENLVIADMEKPIALAGVMGGVNTEVSEKTKDIILESAFFDPGSIRRTARGFGLQTEASYRFERKIDPEGQILALNRATELILQTAGGRAAHGVIDLCPAPFKPRQITLNTGTVKRVLGVEFPLPRVAQILEDLGFGVSVKDDENTWVVKVPLFRWDIDREVDLVEEIARIHGYDKIPASLPSGVISADKKTRLKDFETRVRDVLAGLGFAEAINFSFIPVRVMDDLSPLGVPAQERILVKNPLTSDQNVMRSSLLVGLFQNMVYNQNRQVDQIRLFEIGRCFLSTEAGSLPREILRLGVVMQGGREPHSWRGKPAVLNTFDLKGIVEGLMLSSGVADYAIVVEQESKGVKDPRWLIYSEVCLIKVMDKLIGFLGKVREEVKEYFGLKRDILSLEIDLQPLFEAVKKKVMKSVPKYPFVFRDLALIVGESVAYKEVEETIRQMDINLLQEINLFDIYRGEQIKGERKSLGLSLRYQATDRTLTDQEVNALHEKIIANLGRKFQASLRE